MSFKSHIDAAGAEMKTVPISPRKLNLVASMIKDMNVSKAETYLRFLPKKASYYIRKCLMSAISNADNNLGMDVDLLYVSEIYVGKALTLKRMRPRARGRGSRINKFFSNLTIVLREG